MSRAGAYRWLLAACFATLASCAAPTGDAPAPPPVAARAVAPTVQAPQSTPHYRIDAAASILHILVYRGGTLARLGHNHVISSRSISGNIWRGSSHEDSGFSITVPVNTLIVDDNDARSAEGDDFPLNVTEDARQGTKVNMLPTRYWTVYATPRSASSPSDCRANPMRHRSWRPCVSKTKPAQLPYR